MLIIVKSICLFTFIINDLGYKKRDKRKIFGQLLSMHIVIDPYKIKPLD